ncbi:MAG TPA: SCO family protein, partial [Acidimicrobiia bacterium]|nr:SCO family protein [Acidimicrobiia bacterium]
SLRRDLRKIAARPSLRVAVAVVLAVPLVTTALLGVRAARAWASSGASAVSLRNAPPPLHMDRAAPAVSLVDQNGRRTSFADFQGHTTLLTFAYGHCSIVCPSIVNDLRAARRTANRSDVPLVIVTLDPWRDTPDRLPTLAQHWGLAPRDHVLSGGRAEVEAALDSLGIGRRRDDVTGDIDHATTTLILDERGRIAWRIDGSAFGVADLLGRSR